MWWCAVHLCYFGCWLIVIIILGSCWFIFSFHYLPILIGSDAISIIIASLITPHILIISTLSTRISSPLTTIPLLTISPVISSIFFSIFIFSFFYDLSFSFLISSSCLVTACHLLLSSWSRGVLIIMGNCRHSNILCRVSFHRVFVIMVGSLS